MGSAFHALSAVLAVVGLAVLGPVPAGAAEDAAGPRCPVTVDDQPLSVTTPFSGTLRPRAGDDGTIIGASLLCAYGEGVDPAATVTVTWTVDGATVVCHDIDVAVAPALATAPFARAATNLSATVGPPCPAAAGPVVPAATAAVVGVLITGIVLSRRRRRARSAGGAPGRPSSPDPGPRPVAVEPEPVPPDLEPTSSSA